MRSTSSSCARAREWVSSRLDAELSQFEGALLDAHLASCADCTAYALDVATFTHELRDARREQLEHPVTLPARRRFSLRVAQASAAALAVLAVGLGTVVTALQAQESLSRGDGGVERRAVDRQPAHPIGTFRTEQEWMRWRGVAEGGLTPTVRSHVRRAGTIR